MPRLHALDSHLETANLWMKELVKSLRLARQDYPRAARALRAGLHAIRDRLPNSEVVDLGAQLPTLIRGIYYDGWTLHRDTKPLRDRPGMIARVAKELTPDTRLDPVEVLRATIRLLVNHISEGEIQDVIATLPKPIAVLWQDLAEPGAAAVPVRKRHNTRRTGYSR